MNQILLFGLLPEFLKNYLTQLLLSIVFCLFLREHLEALVTASVRVEVLQIVDSHKKYCNSHPAYHRENPRVVARNQRFFSTLIIIVPRLTAKLPL